MRFCRTGGPRARTPGRFTNAVRATARFGNAEPRCAGERRSGAIARTPCVRIRRSERGADADTDPAAD